CKEPFPSWISNFSLSLNWSVGSQIYLLPKAMDSMSFVVDTLSCSVAWGKRALMSLKEKMRKTSFEMLYVFFI
ncbi:hypothetical protein, partial [Enterococcus innesii]|uniref:hypothetical protein n=1 Tax=Enterococcus innesii TaxID=2839759 RepID=UPI003F86F405